MSKKVILDLATINPNVNGIYYNEESYKSALKKFKDENIGSYIKNGYTNKNTNMIISDINIDERTCTVIIPNDEKIDNEFIGFSISANKSNVEKEYNINKINYACLLDERNNDIKTYVPNIYHIITLCGSTKFKKEFIEVQKQLTLLGNIVISVGCFGHSGDTLTMEDKIMLDDMHKRKILMADEIFVIDKNNYIGSSTKSEIEFAKVNNIPISYYSKDKRISF